MKEIRKIKRVVHGNHATDGAGVKLVRVFGYHDVEQFDPFLMMDAFDSSNPEDYIKGFPLHPHRGIETVTYLIEGEIEHEDSLGNKGLIKNGECQWMTAGSGILHQEMPQASPSMLGIQLWVNLPAKDKMASPAYRDIASNQIPVIEEEGVTIRLISGSYKEAKGVVETLYVQPTFMDVEIKGEETFSLETPKDETLFVYLLRGEGNFENEVGSYISEKNAVLFHSGDELIVKAGPKGLRFLLLLGAPLKEPIAWGGPIVMNTKEELNQAFDELKTGTFIK